MYIHVQFIQIYKCMYNVYPCSVYTNIHMYVMVSWVFLSEGVHPNHLEPSRMQLRLGGLSNLLQDTDTCNAADKGKFSLQKCQQ